MSKRFADAPYFLVDDEDLIHYKRIDEDLPLTFNFNKRLPASDTISTATWTATVLAGTDSSPNDIVSGASSNASGRSTQKIIDGLEGVTYALECEMVSTAGYTFHGLALLKVSDAIR